MEASTQIRKQTRGGKTKNNREGERERKTTEGEIKRETEKGRNNKCEIREGVTKEESTNRQSK
jgi:hypothetical protein